MPSPDAAGFAEVVLPDAPEPPPDPGPIDRGPCAGLPDGAACDDGSACTTGESCASGFCTKGAAVECAPPGGEGCQVALCDPLTGCSFLPAEENAACDVACYAEGRCLSGQCVPVLGSAAVCPTPTDPCLHALACDPGTGQCTVPVWALACPAGSVCDAGQSGEGPLTCKPAFTRLCRPCDADAACDDPGFPEHDDLCVSTGSDGAFCASDCAALPCPEGFHCAAVQGTASPGMGCLPDSTVCTCDPGWAAMGLTTTCRRSNEHGECFGQRACTPGGLTACDAPTPSPEVCDGIDNDCSSGVDDLPGGCGATAACCVSGGCQPLPETSCKVLGGVPQAGVLACAQAACVPGATAACCINPGACLPRTVEQCVQGGGVYRGDGFGCADVDCSEPVITGPCCFATGECQNLPPISCAQKGGVLGTLGVGCVAAACPALGACCFTGNECALTEQQACYAQGGGWLIGQGCQPGACLLQGGQGACCLASGGCVVAESPACQQLEGVFLVNEQCTGQCPQPETGVCCHGPVCAVMSPEDCLDGGQWKGPQASCPSACQEPKGACCAAGSCYQFTESQCDLAGGQWTAPGVTCEEACN